MLSEAVFQPQKCSITLKKPFFAAISSQNYAFAKRYANEICCIPAKKTAYSTSNNAYKSQQNRLSPPDRALFKTRRCKGGLASVRVTPPLPPHRWNTKTTPSAANKVAFKEERQGSRLRTLRLTGELDSHGYRHHPEHTGKRLGLALFPVISKRSFLCNLVVAHLLGWVWRCLFANTVQGAGSYCSL